MWFPSNKSLLMAVCLISIIFHLALAYAIRGMSIQSRYIGNKSLFSPLVNQTQQDYETRNQILKERREVLKIFEEMVEQPPNHSKGLKLPPSQSINMPDLDTSHAKVKFITHQDIDAGVDDLLPREINPPENLFFEDKLLSSESSIDTKGFEQNLPPLRGEIVPESSEDLYNEGGLQVGLAEITPEAFLSTKNFEWKEDSVSLSQVSSNRKVSLIPMGHAEHLNWYIPQEVLLSSDNNEQDSATVASSNDFILHVEYSSTLSNDCVFKLSFIPHKDKSFKRIRQNIYFLIDRSNSIGKKRYALFKMAVSQALDYLSPLDTFNILVFDNRVIRFSENNIPWNEENIKEARQFLDNLPHGGWFASTDLYASLGKIIPKSISDKEVNTALLLSDGDTFLNTENQRKTIASWTKNNKKKVSLYSLAVGKHNNLPLLDLISSLNKGCLVYSKDESGFIQAIVTLMQGIRNPIGKDMSASIVASQKIDLLPQPSRMPDLYKNIPYIIYGRTKSLEDFYVFLQGKYYDTWLDIKHKVSFKEVKKGSNSLEVQWALQRAFDFYEPYLYSGDQKYLKKAKQWLSLYKLPLAFQ